MLWYNACEHAGIHPKIPSPSEDRVHGDRDGLCMRKIPRATLLNLGTTYKWYVLLVDALEVTEAIEWTTLHAPLVRNRFLRNICLKNASFHAGRA